MRPRRASDGLGIPIQVQLLEADHVPFDLTLKLGPGSEITNGIQTFNDRKEIFYVYRSWSKVSILADSGFNAGFFTNGELFLPDTDHAWVTFGVVIDRPGVPGEFDVLVRNATVIGTATTPNMLTTFADPVREYTRTADSGPRRWAGPPAA